MKCFEAAHTILLFFFLSLFLAPLRQHHPRLFGIGRKKHVIVPDANMGRPSHHTLKHAALAVAAGNKGKHR